MCKMRPKWKGAWTDLKKERTQNWQQHDTPSINQLLVFQPVYYIGKERLHFPCTLVHILHPTSKNTFYAAVIVTHHVIRADGYG